MRIVQHCRAFLTAVTDPDVGAGFPLQKAGEIFRSDARQQVALDVVIADKRCRRRGCQFCFPTRVDRRRIATPYRNRISAPQARQVSSAIRPIAGSI
jgi:hypothetical protein